MTGRVRSRRTLAAATVAAVLLAGLVVGFVAGFHVISRDERGVRHEHGTTRILEPGVHLTFPWDSPRIVHLHHAETFTVEYTTSDGQPSVSTFTIDLTIDPADLVTLDRAHPHGTIGRALAAGLISEVRPVIAAGYAQRTSAEVRQEWATNSTSILDGVLDTNLLRRGAAGTGMLRADLNLAAAPRPVEAAGS